MKRMMILILIMFLIAGCGTSDHQQDKALQRPPIKGVSTDIVRAQRVIEYYETTGIVKSRNTAIVSSRIMGEVKEIRVKLGDRVKEGQVLLVIDSPDIKAKVREAEEALKAARIRVEMAKSQKQLTDRTYTRYENLFNEKAISRQEFDEIRTKKEIASLELERAERALKQAEESLKEAEAFAGYSVIRAPFNGIIAEKHIDIGSMVSPGMPLFIVEDEHYTVEVSLDEGISRRVRVGMEVEVVIPSINIKTVAQITEIAPAINPETRTFRTKIDLDRGTGGLCGGMYAVVRIPYGEREVILIPNKALLRRGELTGVYVVDDRGIVSMRLVRTGKAKDGMIEILSGLTHGERIVVDGIEHVVDGGLIMEEGGEK